MQAETLDLRVHTSVGSMLPWLVHRLFATSLMISIKQYVIEHTECTENVDFLRVFNQRKTVFMNLEQLNL